MGRPGDQAALEWARDEIATLARGFAAAAGPVVEAALRRRLEALIVARREWAQGLGPEVSAALREAADRAIAAGAQEAGRRLEDPDVWLQPYTAPGVVHRPETGWDGVLPDWVAGLLHRFTRRDRGPELGDLDDPSNRIWVALLAAAKPLDPVLEEFGLPAAPSPDLGGGHYGLAPRTAAQLDPTGELQRLWKRYVLAYRRYAALSGRAG